MTPSYRRDASRLLQRVAALCLIVLVAAGTSLAHAQDQGGASDSILFQPRPSVWGPSAISMAAGFSVVAGPRIVISSLAELGRRNCACSALSKVVLAAPDLNVRELNEQWPSLRQFKKVKWSIYASSNDLALLLSHIVHRYQRVGDTRPSLFIHADADTIDASGTASFLLDWGHSYVVDNPAVTADIGTWIDKNLAPGARGLAAQREGALDYFVFPK